MARNRIADLRYQKTENDIREAFLKLLRKKEFSQVSVSNIVEQAGINRSTFYAHYMDKYELLERIEQDILCRLQDALCDVHLEAENLKLVELEKMLPCIRSVIHVLYTEGEVISLLLGKNGDPAFAEKLREMIQQVWQTHDVVGQLNMELGYATVVAGGTIFNIILEWARNGFVETEEELAGILLQVAQGNKKILFE
ncbi:MAG: TetR family transcriptional regulator [Peptococcaceae bacterium]